MDIPGTPFISRPVTSLVQIDRNTTAAARVTKSGQPAAPVDRPEGQDVQAAANLE